MQQDLPPRQGQDMPPHATDLSPETIQAFVETQKLKTLNEARELEIRLKEMELNARLAEKSLEFQNDYLRRRPSENRKSITRAGYIILALSGVFLTFLIVLIHLEQREFAEKFLSGLSYIVVSVISFVAGRKKHGISKRRSDGDMIDGSEMMEDEQR